MFVHIFLVIQSLKNVIFLYHVSCIGVCFTPVIPKEIVYLGYLTLLLDFSLLLMIKMVNASTRVSLF